MENGERTFPRAELHGDGDTVGKEGVGEHVPG